MIDAIYNEDCLEGLEKLPDNSVDLICTDPPYCVGTTSNGLKGSFLDNNLIASFFKQLFSQWQRVLKDGGHIYINTDWRTYPFLYPLVNQYLIQRNLIVWDYGWIKAGNWYRFRHEFIIFATNGKSKRTFENCRDNSDVWNIKTINYTDPNKHHQAEKPVELIEKMIKNSSKEGDVVLDCFMGSGTTAVACIKNNRHFIGFEIDEKYFNIANERIGKARAEVAQRLFNVAGEING